jgi:hypothetical protein
LAHAGKKTHQPPQNESVQKMNQFKVGQTVEIPAHGNQQTIMERGSILCLAPTWAILRIGNRSATANLDQIRPVQNPDFFSEKI